MAKTCNNCGTTNNMESIPYVAYQSTVSDYKMMLKRMWVALIVLLLILFATNTIWIYSWMQYDYSSEEIIVDAEDNGNANYIGQDGNIYNGEDNSAETQED